MDIADLRDNGYFWLIIWIVQFIMYRLFFRSHVQGTRLSNYGQAQMWLLMLVTCVCYGPTFLENMHQWYLMFM